MNFTFEVSDKYAVMACRMVADGDTFSDGEQRYIPVLTDKLVGNGNRSSEREWGRYAYFLFWKICLTSIAKRLPNNG